MRGGTPGTLGVTGCAVTNHVAALVGQQVPARLGFATCGGRAPGPEDRGWGCVCGGTAPGPEDRGWGCVCGGTAPGLDDRGRGRVVVCGGVPPGPQRSGLGPVL